MLESEMAQYTLENSSIHLHTFFQRDNKPRHVLSMFLDVLTEKSVDEPCKVTLSFEGKSSCRVPLQVQF